MVVTSSKFSGQRFTLLLLFVNVIIAVDDDVITKKGMIGGNVQLPCDITPPLGSDQMRVVLWYKGDTEVPLYSVDSRSKPIPQHSIHESLGNRAHFVTKSNIPYLTLVNLTQGDDDLYKCRVDFKKSRTITHWVKLQIIVPPDTPTVVDRNGQKLSDQIGPYNEGDPLFLTCLSDTGIPRPSLIWWMSNKVVDKKFKETHKGEISNELVIHKLTRKDLHAELMCEASNNNVTPPATKTVILDLNLKPIEVKIISLKKPMSSGKRIKLECHATGSRPPAVITWWKGSKKMKRAESSPSLDTNLVTSILKFVPSSDDNGKYLSCRADNPRVPGSALEDGWKLQVHYKPIPSLHLGSGVNSDRIFENTDVYFECNIQANPWITKVLWYFEGKEIFTDPQQGVIISTQSLVLEKVNRHRRGNYTCRAVNTEGSGISNPVSLRIQFAPVCKENQKTEYGVSIRERANISCQVEADPSDVSFSWSFISNIKKSQILSFTSKGTTSIASYKPKDEKDYGTLICSAKNQIGGQKSHCTFTILQAGPPGPVSGCTIMNTTREILHVICKAGDDGGLPQTFNMEVYDRETWTLRTNMSSTDAPIFIAKDLPPNYSFTLVIYGKNGKGKGDTTSITATTLKVLQSTMAPKKGFIISPLLGILIGIVATLVLIAIAIVVIMRWKHPTVQQGTPDNEIEEKTYSPVQQENSTENNQSSGERKSPDVIPACIRATNCRQMESRSTLDDHSYTPFYSEELYDTVISKQQDKSRKMKRRSWQSEEFEQSLL
ncbi:Uncharacterised protein g5577 [Pycnogonum litorale]